MSIFTPGQADLIVRAALGEQVASDAPPSLTVAQLITALQALPPDAGVMATFDTGLGFGEVAEVRPGCAPVCSFPGEWVTLVINNQ